MKDQTIDDMLQAGRNRTVVEEGRMTMYISLLSAIRETGGDVNSLEKYIQNGMTVMELIDTLGQNDVGFTVF
jgi:hypothetical protein